MDDNRTGQVIVWVAASVLVILLAMSFTGNGTWMGGVGMAWMMAIPLLLLGGAVYAVYRFDRKEQHVEGPESHKGQS